MKESEKQFFLIMIIKFFEGSLTVKSCTSPGTIEKRKQTHYLHENTFFITKFIDECLKSQYPFTNFTNFFEFIQYQRQS